MESDLTNPPALIRTGAAKGVKLTYLLLGEALSVRTLMGALLILAALLMAGAKPVSNPEVA